MSIEAIGPGQEEKFSDSERLLKAYVLESQMAAALREGLKTGFTTEEPDGSKRHVFTANGIQCEGKLSSEIISLTRTYSSWTDSGLSGFMDTAMFSRLNRSFSYFRTPIEANPRTTLHSNSLDAYNSIIGMISELHEPEVQVNLDAVNP